LKILAAMSGGVDSSVAALRLVEDGHDVIGVMMKLFENEDIGEDILKSCCSLADKGDAESAAAVIDIPFYVFNYTDKFREYVMDDFVRQYSLGRTPNPCIECNRSLKFGALFERADIMKCSHVATGHYARITREPSGRYGLRRGGDRSKDQSYALYFLSQEQLGKIVFPLGDLTKREVREIAEAGGLKNSKKPDSQDICFVPRGGYGDFLDEYTGEASEPGDFVDVSGRIIGKHRGYRNYTIGQRRGLRISAAERLYVTAVDPEHNTVTLGHDCDLWKDRLEADRLNLIAADKLSGEIRCEAKIRYMTPAQSAKVRQTGEDTIEVIFDEPVRAITPGQAVVLYDGDTVIGGATIRC